MASLFNTGPGNILYAAKNTVRSSTSSTSSFFSGSILMYILVVAFIALVLLMLYGTRINWSRFDPRPMRWIIQQDSTLNWKPIGPFTNLTIPKNEIITDFEDDTYTMVTEVLLNNSRNYWTEEGPYRHIAHRGSDELIQAKTGGIALSGCGISMSNSTLPPFGLPKRMNPGIFLDPNVNDILVFVDTTDKNETFRESVRIKDVPLDIPLRISIVLNRRVLEVYLNCGLEVTKLLSHDPKHVENEWYGIAGAAAAQAQIQNMYLWKRSLPSTDMKYLCPPIVKQFRAKPECPDSAASTQAPKTTQKVNIGFGSHVEATCKL